MEDHDQRIKVVLQTFFREFFELFFPDWAPRFAWPVAEWPEKEAFLDPPRGRRRVLDLVAKVNLAESVQVSEREPESSLILVHVEVDSSEGVADVPQSMFGYYAWLRARHRLPVFPISVYLRVGYDGLGWSTHQESLWDKTLLQFHFPYIGLPALDAAEYVQGNNWLGVALSALMNVSARDKARLKAEALQRILTSPLNKASSYLLGECVEAYLALEGPHLEEYNHLLVTRNFQEALMFAKTSFELGVEKGIDKGQVALIRRMMERKFSDMNDAVKNRLESFSSEQINQLADKLLTANSLAELGLTDE